MKLKDLPDNVNAQEVLVKIPEHIKIPDYGTAPKREVYFAGYQFGQLFVKIKPTHKRIYPILNGYEDPLEWEVIDKKYIEN